MHFHSDTSTQHISCRSVECLEHPDPDRLLCLWRCLCTTWLTFTSFFIRAHKDRQKQREQQEATKAETNTVPAIAPLWSFPSSLQKPHPYSLLPSWGHFLLYSLYRKTLFEWDPCTVNYSLWFGCYQKTGRHSPFYLRLDDLLIASKSQAKVYKVRDLIQKELIESKIKEGNGLWQATSMQLLQHMRMEMSNQMGGALLFLTRC